MEQEDNNNNSQSNSYTSYPGQNAANEIASLTKILLEVPNILNTLRREFRGEAIYTDDTGETHWIQVCKPMFIKIDPISRKPIKVKQKYPDGIDREVYLPNDEAIDEVLSMLKFAGINTLTPITKITGDNVLDDLKEFECKLAAVLALKQVSWGLDKELLPMTQFKIKTIVQDARYMAENGNILKAIQTTVQRVEQSYEGDRGKSIRGLYQ